MDLLKTIGRYAVWSAIALIWFSVYYAFCEGIPNFDTFMIVSMLILLISAAKSLGKEEEEEETAK